MWRAVYIGAGAGGAVVLLLVVMAVIYVLKHKMAGKRARMDPRGEVTMTTSRTFRSMTDSPSSAHIRASGIGQEKVVGTVVREARFDPNTGQPNAKLDDMMGKQNGGDGCGSETRL